MNFQNINSLRVHHFSRSTRTSSVATVARSPTSSSLKMTDRSFRYASLCLWGQLSTYLHQPHSSTSFSISDSPIPSPITSSTFDSPPYSSITLCRLETYLFHKSYPVFSLLPLLLPSLTFAGPFLLRNSVFVFRFFLIFFLVLCARLSRLLGYKNRVASVSFWAHVNISSRIVSYLNKNRAFSMWQTPSQNQIRPPKPPYFIDGDSPPVSENRMNDCC